MTNTPKPLRERIEDAIKDMSEYLMTPNYFTVGGELKLSKKQGDVAKMKEALQTLTDAQKEIMRLEEKLKNWEK